MRHHKEYQKMGELFKLFEDSGVDNGLINMILNLSPRTDLSPKGFISFLQLIYDALQDFPSFFQKIFQVNFFLIFIKGFYIFLK